MERADCNRTETRAQTRLAWRLGARRNQVIRHRRQPPQPQQPPQGQRKQGKRPRLRRRRAAESVTVSRRLRYTCRGHQHKGSRRRRVGVNEHHAPAPGLRQVPPHRPLPAPVPSLPRRQQLARPPTPRLTVQGLERARRAAVRTDTSWAGCPRLRKLWLERRLPCPLSGALPPAAICKRPRAQGITPPAVLQAVAQRRRRRRRQQQQHVLRRWRLPRAEGEGRRMRPPVRLRRLRRERVLRRRCSVAAGCQSARSALLPLSAASP